MTLAQGGAMMQHLPPSSLLRPKAVRASAAAAQSLSATPTHYIEAEMRHSTPGRYQPSAHAYELFTHLKTPPSRHWSVYKGESVYDSYGPVYNLGSNPGMERYYKMLFEIDRAQLWVSPPIVPNIKIQPEHQQQQYATSQTVRSDRQTVNGPRPQQSHQQQQQQVYPEKPKTVSRRRTSGQAKATPAPATPATAAHNTSKQASRRASGSSTATASSAAHRSAAHRIPAQQQAVAMAVAVANPITNAPHVVPPPKQLIRGRRLTTEALILRRVASFLDESDAVRLARSCRPLYETLDYSWWISVYRDVKRDEKGNLLVSWPCSSGWCDSCELYNSSIIVHEISKARLCAKCTDIPDLQDIKASEAKSVYSLTGKSAAPLLKLLPFTLTRKCKMFWKPHIKWVQEIVTGDCTPLVKEPARQQAEKATSVTLLRGVTHSTRPDQGRKTSEQGTETKKRSIRIVNLGGTSKSSDTSNLSEPPTSSTIEHRSPPQDYSSASYICTSESAELDDGVLQAQKRQRVDEKASEQQVSTHSRPSDESAREVRYVYLKHEAVNAGMRLPEWGGPLSGTLLHFVNGEWEEVAKQGIGINDFGGMIHHLQAGAY